MQANRQAGPCLLVCVMALNLIASMTYLLCGHIVSCADGSFERLLQQDAAQCLLCCVLLGFLEGSNNLLDGEGDFCPTRQKWGSNCTDTGVLSPSNLAKKELRSSESDAVLLPATWRILWLVGAIFTAAMFLISCQAEQRHPWPNVGFCTSAWLRAGLTPAPGEKGACCGHVTEKPGLWMDSFIWTKITFLLGPIFLRGEKVCFSDLF